MLWNQEQTENTVMFAARHFQAYKKNFVALGVKPNIKQKNTEVPIDYQ